MDQGYKALPARSRHAARLRALDLEAGPLRVHLEGVPPLLGTLQSPTHSDQLPGAGDVQLQEVAGPGQGAVAGSHLGILLQKRGQVNHKSTHGPDR